MTTGPALKPVIWVGSSREDLREFPRAYKITWVMPCTSRGGKHRDTKTLSRFGGAVVLEVLKDYRGDTFRAVYTARFANAERIAKEREP